MRVAVDHGWPARPGTYAHLLRPGSGSNAGRVLYTVRVRARQGRVVAAILPEIELACFSEFFLNKKTLRVPETKSSMGPFMSNLEFCCAQQ